MKTSTKKRTVVCLGDEVEDTVSKFRGIAVGEFKYLTGCRRFAVQPPVEKDGKLPEAHTFDEIQLKIVRPVEKTGVKFEVPANVMTFTVESVVVADEAKKAKAEAKKPGGPALYNDKRRF